MPGISVAGDLRQFLERYHMDSLAKASIRGGPVEVPFGSLEHFDMGLADKLVEEPERVLAALRQAATRVDAAFDIPDDVEIQVKDLPPEHTYAAGETGSEEVGRLLAIEGIAKRVSEKKPRIREAVFECRRCGELQSIRQNIKRFEEPHLCSGCERKGPFNLLIGESSTRDVQTIEVQQSPEEMRGGETPNTVEIVAEDLPGGEELVPGSKARVTGVYKAHRPSGRRNTSPVLDTYLVANYIEVLEKDFEEIEVTKEDRERIEEMVEQRDMYGELVKSICPTIKTDDAELKEAIALQLFGGISKTGSDGSFIRGDIHLLIIGDPGTGKSRMAQHVEKLSPKGVYVSGESSTSAGLTTTAQKDEDGAWTLEAGALVLADKGACIIDELDKVKREDRSALHEAMSSQKISPAKAGNVTSLKARCSVLASANPKYGRFDRFEPVAEQIDLSPTLLSRFDLIYLLTDRPDPEKDREISTHISQTHRAGAKRVAGREPGLDVTKPAIDPETLRKYVAYAKKNIHPYLTKRAESRITKFYVEMRDTDEDSSGEPPIAVTPRQIEGLIRLAEASARVELSEKVRERDANRAIRLMKTCLKEVGIDPDTGEYDIDLVATGTGRSQRQKIRLIGEMIRELQTEHGKASLDDLREKVGSKGLELNELKAKLEKMRQNGEVYYPDNDHVRLT